MHFLGFYGIKIAFSASKPNAVGRGIGKLGCSVVNTTIASKIELFDRFPIEKSIRLAVPPDGTTLNPEESLHVTPLRSP